MDAEKVKIPLFPNRDVSDIPHPNKVMPVTAGRGAGQLAAVLENHDVWMVLQSITYSKLALRLLATGVYSKASVVTYSNLAETIGDAFAPTFFDENYLVMPKEFWQLVCSEDLIKYIMYIADLFDCDDYAKLFSALIAAFFLVNTAGIAYGRVYDQNGNLLGLHAFNVVPVLDGNAIVWYVIEPQTGQMAQMKDDGTAIMDGYVYAIKLATFG